jgi:hypothetical protein
LITGSLFPFRKDLLVGLKAAKGANMTCLCDDLHEQYRK